jgi:hypothetical protein
VSKEFLVTKAKTYYEQIPVEMVKTIIARSAANQPSVAAADKPEAPVSPDRKENTND